VLIECQHVITLTGKPGCQMTVTKNICTWFIWDPKCFNEALYDLWQAALPGNYAYLSVLIVWKAI